MLRLGKFFRGLLAAVLLVLIGANLWLLAAQTMGRQTLPTIGGYTYLIVLSGSMEPAISAGDVIIIHRQDSYTPGEIITFADDGALTTHRITAVTGEGYRTQGDANNAPDQLLIPSEAIQGRVVAVIPRLGQALLFLRRPAGLLLLLALGGAVFLAAETHTHKGRGDSQ